MADAASTGRIGTWTVISGPNIPTLSNIHQNNTGVSNLIEGTYVFRWDVTGPCANGSAFDTIIVQHALGGVTGASAGASQGFCDAQLSFVLTGNNPTYANETVTWTLTSGQSGVVIQTPNSSSTNVTVPAAAGTYTFSYSINNSVTGVPFFCIDFPLPYYVNPTISLEANPILPCDDSLATISYTLTGGGVPSMEHC